MRTAVVIPVKAFHAAKARLAPALDRRERALLARSMATAVVQASGGLAVTVVCDDPDVRRWAEQLGVSVCWSPGLGLDGAVAAGVEAVRSEGADRVVVAHADLPMASDLSAVAGDDGVLLVPDRHGDGTNVISLPADCGFRFSYGPGSFHRHRAEVLRLGLELTVHGDESLSWDVDHPEDLDHPSGSLRL